MSVLITDPAAGVWVKHLNGSGEKHLPCCLPWPCMPCAGAGCAAICCQQTRQCVLMHVQSGREISRMPAVPGVCHTALSPCARYVYQLSAEADCIHTRCAATGELLFAAPAGVFPRMMRQSPDGGLLLAAGGAVNEACVFQAPQLLALRVITTRHPCFGACFWQGGVLLVCAVEGEDIQTAVYTLAEGRLRPRRLTELPGQPGGLCICPDGRHALMSTSGGLMKLCLDTGELVWNRPEWALCTRIECRGDEALISDTLDGRVYLFNHHRPWERRVLLCGAAAQACFL